MFVRLFSFDGWRRRASTRAAAGAAVEEAAVEEAAAGGAAADIDFHYLAATKRPISCMSSTNGSIPSILDSSGPIKSAWSQLSFINRPPLSYFLASLFTLPIVGGSNTGVLIEWRRQLLRIDLVQFA